MIGLALLAQVALAPAPRAPEPGSTLQVYLMTMGPGADIYERFGHDAIWIHDTTTNADLVYNFGTFEVPEGLGGLLGFMVKFALGPPQYSLGVDHGLQRTITMYQGAQRDVRAQQLNLTPAQRADLAARLATNALPQNKFYAYYYFRDNCATRVRDLLDLELGGALKRATAGKPAEGTLRFHTQRSITNDKFLFVAIDASFGPRVDRPLDQWDEMFLPGKVADRVAEMSVPGPNGQPVPLVQNSFPMLTIGVFHVEPAPPRWALPLALIGLVVAGLILLSRSASPVGMLGRAVGGGWSLLMGVGGAILLFFWIATKHIDTYANHNLLILSPLALGLITIFWRRGEGHKRVWAPRLGLAIMGSVVIGTLLAILPGGAGQQTGNIVALAALPTFVVGWEGWRKG